MSLDLDQSPHIFHSQSNEKEQNEDVLEKQKKIEEEIEAYRKGIELHKMYDSQGKYKFILPRVDPLPFIAARIEPYNEPNTRLNPNIGHTVNEWERKVGKKEENTMQYLWTKERESYMLTIG